MTKVKWIPQEVVTAFIEGVSFDPDGENDLAIAENIAGNTYESLDDLIRHCRSHLKIGKTRLKNFEDHVKMVRHNKYFIPYLNPHK